jgi:putative transposase
MLKAIFSTFRFIILILAGHKEIALENAALRQQLTILKREQPRPKLQHRHRLFCIALMKIWKRWRTALGVVQPATVVSWQRRRFKQYWSRLSQKKRPGRPKVSAEVRKLVRTMAAANVTWGGPRIHGELLKLGFEMSERSHV